MKPTPDHDILELRRCDIVRLRDAAGALLKCRRGSLWVTQEDDHRDIVLSAGHSLRLANDGVTLAEALEPATLMLEGRWTEVDIHRPRGPSRPISSPARRPTTTLPRRQG
ncbi:MAG: DUF2917 domain-containing protein [Burkholderiales bacterium]